MRCQRPGSVREPGCESTRLKEVDHMPRKRPRTAAVKRRHKLAKARKRSLKKYGVIGAMIMGK